MNIHITKALQSLDEAELATFFDEMDKVSLPKSMMPNYAKFKKEFMHSNTSFEFVDRLRVFANSLAQKTVNIKSSEEVKEKEPISDSRKIRKVKRIQKNIEETEGLLGEWEEKRRNAENPSERNRAKQKIEELEDLLDEYEQDLEGLK